VSRYLRILRAPAARRPFAAAVVARLPISMAPLGIVLLVQDVRGSYAIAGLVTAAFALSQALGTPVWGRLVDRVGQPRVLGPTGVVSGVLLAVLALVTVGGAGDAVLLVLAAGVGLSFPPVTPAMRGAWRVVLEHEDDRRAAYALDAVAVETIFVGGPLLLSVLLVVAPAAVPLLVTAALLAGGSLAYTATHAARSWRPEPHADGAGSRGASPLRARGVAVVLFVALAMAIGFGLIDVSIAATARESLGNPAQLGVLFACIAGGSAVGGLWYGSRTWHGPERRRLPVTMGLFALGAASLGLLLGGATGDGVPHPPLWLLLALLVGTGLAIAPGLIIEANLVDELAPRDRLNEAQAWLNTAFTAGGATGTAIAGVLVDLGGPGRSFLGGAAALVVATLAALAGQRWWRGAAVRETAAAGATRS
jgi:MFS family permease